MIPVMFVDFGAFIFPYICAVDTVLRLNSLSKHFGKIVAVNDLSLEIPKGSIFGILGPNGSGKTTTLGMVLDIIRPTGGSFEWFGQAPGTATRKKIGAILEGPLFYPYLSAVNNLKIVADIKEVDYSRIEPVLEMVNLIERKNSAFKTYSLGMKQRLAIAAALLAEPQVLILDEPTNGLDPQGIAEIRALIRDIGQNGTTILLASHLLDEVEKVCDHVAVLKQGQLLYSGRVDGMPAGQFMVEVGADDMNALKIALESFPGIVKIGIDGNRALVTLSATPNPAAINRHLFDKGVVASYLAERKTSLEQQFLELTQQAS